MRGYGSWCMGWREAERQRGQPPENNGCATVLVCGFLVLFALSAFKVAVESGSGFAVLFGIAILAGMFQGMGKR